MTAKLFDQIGLIFGFISGLLLIPEVINLFPLAKLEESIEKRLYKFENLLKFPLRFSPPSWRYRFTEEQREAIEPATAIRSLVFSIIWIAILMAGIIFSYNLLVLLSFIILAAIVIGNMRKHIPSLRLLSVWRKITIFISSLFLLMFVTPIISLLRVITLVLRLIINRTHKIFSTNDVLHISFMIFAVVAFIISNILQFVATLL